MNMEDYREYVSTETMMGPNSVRILAELLDKYPLRLASDDLILDLGCGTGLTSPYYRKSPRQPIAAQRIERGHTCFRQKFSLIFSLYRFKTAFTKPSMRSALSFCMVSVKCA